MSELSIYTIYRRPLDHPSGYAVTRWQVLPGAEPEPIETWRATDSLDEARALIPPGLFRLARDPGDDPVIVESWL